MFRKQRFYSYSTARRDNVVLGFTYVYCTLLKGTRRSPQDYCLAGKGTYLVMLGTVRYPDVDRSGSYHRCWIAIALSGRRSM